MAEQLPGELIWATGTVDIATGEVHIAGYAACAWSVLRAYR